ncbi:MAG TPA: sigma-54 dependent transcriptional regulator [Bryobacteraceae bacterium]|jgi:two-component system NtrC family response regulator|nr:sigma-54 dependent transcriptional regulator [Bryobacteraceae bacterium]
MNPPRILVVDDDANLRWVLETQLEQMGYTVTAAADGAAAIQAIEKETPALVLTDLKMPGVSGMELLEQIRRDYPEIPVLIITAFGTIQSAVQAMRAGAYDYLAKPIDYDELGLSVSRVLEHFRLVEEVRTLRASLDRKYGFENIIGHSETLLSVLETAARAAQSNSTILVHGETGTGKELLAKAIHFNSRRRDRPFVTINCGAIPRDLLESELFGHVKGSFTGAMAHKAGKVELADRGTLFLDEIGEMPGELQVKLLRLIQQGELEKVGAPAAVKVDVRFVTATHRNLQAMVEDGTFREDLYYRLAVIPLELPPLRDRADDIPELVQHFFVQAKEVQGRPDLVLPAGLLPRFQDYRWPGNIRELENVIERVVVLARGEEITLADLPDFLRRERPAVDMLQLELPARGISLEAVEKELILRALEKFRGNQTHAARYLDISRKALRYRMEKHGIVKRAAEDEEDLDLPEDAQPRIVD